MAAETMNKKYLSHFAVINLKFVNLSLYLFVTLCHKFFQKGSKRVYEVFLSHFAIKIKLFKSLPNNFDSICIFTVTTFQNCQEGTIAVIVDVIVT